jgi:hypothetical protein
MIYNWELWDNFEAAAKELDLELRSQDGGCVTVNLSKDIHNKFWIYCWTPLNKLKGIIRDRKEGSKLDTWQHRLNDLRQNHADFHLEFGAKEYDDGSMFWFPKLNSYNTTPSKDDIVEAIKIMMDTKNFEKHKLLAVIKQESYDHSN